MTIKSLYPTVRPTLNLDFAKTKVLDPRVTFSRASTGTFVGANGLIQTAASGAARFDHNPETGESLGLLVEEARTNLFTYSEAFGTWNLIRLTVSGDVAVAPNATTTADKLVEGATDDNRHARLDVSALTGSYTFSCFMKASERTYGYLSWGTNIFKSALFNLSAGAVTSSSGCVASIQALPNSWYRCVISVTAANENFACVGPATTATNNLYAYQGNGTSGIYVWGAQLETGAFPTSYIPTVASTVTRAADVASITGTNFSSWYNQSAGSFFVSANHKGSSNFNNAVFLKVNNGTVNNQIKIFSVGADPYLYITDTGAVQAYIDAGSVSVGLPNKYAAGFTTNNFALSVNGATAVTDASGTNPTGMTQLAIGAGLSGVGQPNGTIARLAYYPVRLPDTQLQALTAT